jgi:hypothetical protein
MPWCPKCHAEYDEPAVTICADCNVPLVDELPTRPEPPQNLPAHDLSDLNEPVLLLTAPDTIQADMLLTVLQERKIPAFKKSHAAAACFSTIAGTASVGEEIYVPRRLITQALELADAMYLPEGSWELPVLEEDLIVEDTWEDIDEELDEKLNEGVDEDLEADFDADPAAGTSTSQWLWPVVLLIVVIVILVWKFASKI